MEVSRYTSVRNGKKTCTVCKVEKPIEDFYLYKKNGSQYPYSRCKPCENERSTKWQQANPERARQIRERYKAKHPDYFRITSLQKNYGLTPEEYDALRAAQGGKCAICDTDDPRGRGKERLSFAVDHDHVTGEIRGLLCFECNTGLAMFRDSPEFLAMAMAYLNRTDGLDGRN